MPNPEDTSKVGASTHGIELNTSGPYTEELEQEIAKDALGDGAATEPLREGSNAEKESKDTVGTNPKRTENSRPD